MIPLETILDKSRKAFAWLLECVEHMKTDVDLNKFKEWKERQSIGNKVKNVPVLDKTEATSGWKRGV